MSEQTSNPTSGQSVPKSRKSKFRQKSQQQKTAESKLRMERRGEKLDAARKKLAKQKPLKPKGPVRRVAGVAGRGVHGFVHGKIYEVEHENVGTEGAHRTELAGETVLRHGTRFVKKQVREHPARAVRRAESRHTKATADYYYRKTVEEHPEMQKGGALSRYLQKQKIKRQYAKQVREAAKQGGKTAEKAVSSAGKLTEKVVAYAKEHPVGLLAAALCLILLLSLQSCLSSMTTVGNGLVGAVAASTYPSEDADMLGAEAAYCAMEDELQDYLDSYQRTHDYDEYHFDLDDIEHDPYVLISILTALREGAWTLEEVQGTLQMLFDRQYILTEDVVVEQRYYLETDTWTDEDGNTHSDTYRVYYDYYICYVTLENFNLSHLPIYIMGEDQLSRYALYMATLGNRPDLFPSSPYVEKYTSPPVEHDIPEAYLADETFAAILKEAEKYIGFPYVWGGSSPSTSFDCSGFVSYVYNQCGWSFGRLGAQGLYNISTRTSSPKPGDLVFFTGTYDTPGISHVGIYVGDGWMLHCGDPIGYANLNSSYWQSHFYAYGKLF
ncbi:C40 family peptidase [Flintibacter faecis]|uniref:C40 family peptidase n=1 Tax=Flintibacter faecis TaxID=2763047 RepID=A0A8J6J4X3_9FIRM|nr:C40 family peptidase [Flintibacter faecis]MBC5716997.1 C40 family peptidase [Flintibacter faecis]